MRPPSLAKRCIAFSTSSMFLELVAADKIYLYSKSMYTYIIYTSKYACMHVYILARVLYMGPYKNDTQ